jgi:hypothetical protein
VGWVDSEETGKPEEKKDGALNSLRVEGPRGQVRGFAYDRKAGLPQAVLLSQTVHTRRSNADIMGMVDNYAPCVQILVHHFASEINYALGS